MREIKIGNKVIGENQPVFIIAEMACSHEGSLENAKKLVKVATEAKADAIQFQVFLAREQVVPHHESYALVSRVELSPDEWTELFDYSKQFDLLRFSAAYDKPSVNLVSKLGVDAFKIHSSDLSNLDLVRDIAWRGKPITLGTGASTLGEIEEAINVIKSEGNEDIILMHGMQNFPTNVSDANLKFLKTLKNVFQLPVGSQDHTDADSELSLIVPLLAIPLGTSVIEKHFTLDRNLKGTDHEAALNPGELKKFVEYVRVAEGSLGSFSPHPFTPAEIKYRKYAKKSIVAARDIKAGEKLTKDMFLCLISTPGLPPTEADKIVGRTAKVDIRQYENIVWKKVK